MAAAGKISVKESVDYVERHGGLDLAGRKHENVSIVVLASQLRQLHFPADGRAYALMFVEGHGYAVAGSADANGWITFTVDNRLCAWMCVVWIIAAIGRMASEIGEIYALALKVAFNYVFQFVACVVAA